MKYIVTKDLYCWRPTLFHHASRLQHHMYFSGKTIISDLCVGVWLNNIGMSEAKYPFNCAINDLLFGKRTTRYGTSATRTFGGTDRRNGLAVFFIKCPFHSSHSWKSPTWSALSWCDHMVILKGEYIQFIKIHNYRIVKFSSALTVSNWK